MKGSVIMAGRKFATPNAYTAIVQSANTDTQEAPKEFYRFNMRLPAEYQQYLAEMAWRNRTTITAYMTDLVKADMEAHPEWRDSLDILNTKK